MLISHVAKDIHIYLYSLVCVMLTRLSTSTLFLASEMFSLANHKLPAFHPVLSPADQPLFQFGFSL